MSRSSARTRTQSAAEEIVRAAEFFPGLTSSANSFDGFLEQQQAMRRLDSALHAHKDDATVMRHLLLQYEVPRQICNCLAAALQHLAGAATNVSPEEPALAVAAHLANLVGMPSMSTRDDHECVVKLATDMLQSGEQQLGLSSNIGGLAAHIRVPARASLAVLQACRLKVLDVMYVDSSSQQQVVHGHGWTRQA
jgi:hypothetical protein